MEKEKMTKLEKQWVLYDVGNSAFVYPRSYRFILKIWQRQVESPQQIQPHMEKMWASATAVCCSRCS